MNATEMRAKSSKMKIKLEAENVAQQIERFKTNRDNAITKGKTRFHYFVHNSEFHEAAIAYATARGFFCRVSQQTELANHRISVYAGFAPATLSRKQFKTGGIRLEFDTEAFPEETKDTKWGRRPRDTFCIVLLLIIVLGPITYCLLA